MSFLENFRAAFPAEKEAQIDRLKIPKNIELAGGKTLGTDDVKYIINNTYQYNDDGTSYGVGKDGRPYSYKLRGAMVDDVTSLDMEEQRNLIKRLTNGEIRVADSIASPENLSWILQGAKRMQDYGNGNFRPRNVDIMDMNVLSDYKNVPPSTVLGEYDNGAFTDNGVSRIFLRGTNNPEEQRRLDYEDFISEWQPAYGHGASVTIHELAHAADEESYGVIDPSYGTATGSKSPATKSYEDIFKEAAKNTGYDSVEDAISYISGYAQTNYAEAIAEAYSDVLLNGNKAGGFSKELIKLLSERADARSNLAGERNKKSERLMAQARDLLPNGTLLETPGRTMDRFRRNWKLAE